MNHPLLAAKYAATFLLCYGKSCVIFPEEIKVACLDSIIGNYLAVLEGNAVGVRKNPNGTEMKKQPAYKGEGLRLEKGSHGQKRGQGHLNDRHGEMSKKGNTNA